MLRKDKIDSQVVGSKDPNCPIRRMLAEELVRQRALDWASAAEEDRRWAQEEALKMQMAHNEIARSMFSPQGPASGETK